VTCELGSYRVYLAVMAGIAQSIYRLDYGLEDRGVVSIASNKQISECLKKSSPFQFCAHLPSCTLYIAGTCRGDKVAGGVKLTHSPLVSDKVRYAGKCTSL